MRLEEAFLVEDADEPVFRVPFGVFAAFAVEDEVEADAEVVFAAAVVALVVFVAVDAVFLAVVFFAVVVAFLVVVFFAVEVAALVVVFAVFLVAVDVPAAFFFAVDVVRVFLGLGGL